MQHDTPARNASGLVARSAADIGMQVRKRQTWLKLFAVREAERQFVDSVRTEAKTACLSVLPLFLFHRLHNGLINERLHLLFIGFKAIKTSGRKQPVGSLNAAQVICTLIKTHLI